MQEIESIKEFGGYLKRYQHFSSSCNCEMTFSVFLPDQVNDGPLPSLYWLSGLTCTDDNVRAKAGAARYAAEHGIVLIMPDTSPRGDDVADDSTRYDLGKGAGFYVNATQAPWSQHYQMYDYINRELLAFIEETLPVVPGLKSIFGHSMGGHGALISAIKEQGSYRSASAFSPICHPVACPWGHGCFGAYLGDDSTQWAQYDATELIKAGASAPAMLIDQGTADQFLAEQLLPQDLQDACEAKGIALTVRMQEGYDHSYYFIASFIGEHIAFHASHLK